MHPLLPLVPPAVLLGIAVSFAALRWSLGATNEPTNIIQFRAEYTQRLATAIYHAEGAEKTYFPYGVKLFRNGVPVPAENPRGVCIDIINHRLAAWKDAGMPGDFVGFLALRYCPMIGNDTQGQANWIKNVNWFLTHPK